MNIIKHFCKNCGKEFIPCHKTSLFCSKSCATSWRNKEKLKDGTHNFIGMDKGLAARKLVAEGKHPFQKGNMSEDALKRKAKGIKQARLKESKEHKHAWQQPKNFIENEFSRSFSVLNKSSYTNDIYLYIAECDDYIDAIKIGWTRNIKIREKDSRTIKIKNLQIIKTGKINEILNLEKEIKLKFFNEDYYKLYNSTEIFPIEQKQNILNFINSY